MSEHFVTYEQVIKKKVARTVKIELAHCPFCGGEAEFRTGGNYHPKLNRRKGIGVRCKDCKALTPVKESGDCPEQLAAECWNRRVEA